MSDDTYFEAVAEVARVVGEAAMVHYHLGFEVEFKKDGSPVTIADRSAEQAARRMVERLFPEDGFIGEEFPPTHPHAKRQWIVDPIDGTKSFVRRVPLWGSLVAVAEGETILAGSVFLPAVGELVVAAPGRGCWWNGSRCSVSDVSRLDAAIALTSQLPFGGSAPQIAGWHALEQKIHTGRTWGDCFGYLMVATGRAEIMVDSAVSPWDIAALLPIVAEAGGVFTDWTGTSTAFGGNAIATNAALAEETRLVLTSQVRS